MPNFEEQAKRTLQDHPSPVDSTKLWSNIAPQLPSYQEDDKKIGLWSTIGMLFLGIFLGLSILFLTENTSSQDQTSQAATPSTITKPSTHHTPISTLTEPEYPLVQTQEIATAETQPTASQPSAARPSKYSNASPNVVKRSTLSSKTQHTATKNTSTKAQKEPSSSVEMTIKTPIKQTTISNTASNVSSAANKQIMAREATSAFVPMVPLATTFPDLLNQPLDLSSYGPETDCYSFGSNKMTFYASIYGGIGYPIKHLEARSNEPTNIVDLRLKTEEVLEVLETGFVLGIMPGKHFFAEVGVEYQRINERFKLDRTVLDTIGEFITIENIYDANGMLIESIIDSVSITEQIDYNKTTYNHFTTWSIPIGIGYEWGRFKRWGGYVKGGAQFRFNTSYKAEMMTSENTSELFLSSQTDSKAPYSGNADIVPFVGLGLKYNLTQNLDLLAEARYQQYLNSITAGTYPATQTYQLITGNIGLRLRF